MPASAGQQWVLGRSVVWIANRPVCWHCPVVWWIFFPLFLRIPTNGIPPLLMDVAQNRFALRVRNRRPSHKLRWYLQFRDVKGRNRAENRAYGQYVWRFARSTRVKKLKCVINTGRLPMWLTLFRRFICPINFDEQRKCLRIRSILLSDSVLSGHVPGCLQFVSNQFPCCS